LIKHWTRIGNPEIKPHNHSPPVLEKVPKNIHWRKDKWYWED
jgi:hypothetical protein